jgi:hypothetical protein
VKYFSLGIQCIFNTSPNSNFSEDFTNHGGETKTVDVCEGNVFYLLGYVFSIFTLQVTITTVSAFG